MIRKQTAVGRKSGTILIELNLFFMTLLIACGVGINCGQMIFHNMPRVLADIELYQAARYTQNILKRELSYNVASIRLSKGFNDRDQLVCCKTKKNVKLYWYVSGKMLYRKTIKGMSIGVNPFSCPEMQIIDFSTERLASDRLKLIVTMKETRSGLTRTFPWILRLSNGTVEGS